MFLKISRFSLTIGSLITDIPSERNLPSPERITNVKPRITNRNLYARIIFLTLEVLSALIILEFKIS